MSEQFVARPPTESITELLRAWSDGEREGVDALVPLVYEELKRQARRYLRRERAGHTLQTTALVNEAYLRLIDQRNVKWQNRAHFFGIAAQMMRRILVDYAKNKHRQKRGGTAENLPLEEAFALATKERNLDLLALDEALNRLATKEEHLAKIVEHRFFSGLDVVETADALGLSESTVKRDWQMAKAWLHRELTR